MHLLIPQSGSAQQCLPNVIGFQVRVLDEKLIHGYAVATSFATGETVMRMPRMQARPPITRGSCVILANILDPDSSKSVALLFHLKEMDRLSRLSSFLARLGLGWRNWAAVSAYR